METCENEFELAVKEVQKLTKRPGTDTLLQLYSLFKQATEGDNAGSRPGMLDLKGRKKFDVWKSLKGTSRDKAMREYVELVQRLKNHE